MIALSPGTMTEASVECHVPRDEYQDRDEEDAYLVILSSAVLTAIREGLAPQGDYMKPENVFYSLENHHKLRCAAPSPGV